ncbi:MAG: PilZ domain-containing protein [Methylococcales bacterium]|jgi:hypothetical protein|nr:PilZ domain-containing protein [Methylococcales bacterium]MBT7446031.1 PilZ domain-containing protein [Methylococcales bacterium]
MYSPEKRKNHRSGLRLPIELLLGETALSGHTVDVSLCGIAVSLEGAALHITTQQCRIRLTVNEGPIEVNCILVRQSAQEIGLEFIESSIEKTRKLTEFLKHKL